MHDFWDKYSWVSTMVAIAVMTALWWLAEFLGDAADALGDYSP